MNPLASVVKGVLPVKLRNRWATQLGERRERGEKEREEGRERGEKEREEGRGERGERKRERRERKRSELAWSKHGDRDKEIHDKRYKLTCT